MASAQVVRSAEALFYEKNKDVVDEMMKGAKLNDDQQMFGARTVAQIKTDMSRLIVFSASKDWSGKVQTPYPGFIGDDGMFVHASDIGVGPGDVAAVVYATSKSNDGWLLAWSVSALPVPDDYTNKVYVEAGPVDKLTNWDEIKAKLDASGSTSHYLDKPNGTEMYAKISPLGNYAELAAIYNKYIPN